MKNKKAFTITEILAALIILGVVMAIAVPGVSMLQKHFRNSYYEKLEGSILEAAKTYYKDNAESKPKDILDYASISFEDLESKKYLDEIKGYKKDSIDGDVFIVNVGKDDKYIYKLCYKVNNDPKYAKLTYVAGPNEVPNEDNICYFESSEVTNTFEEKESLNIHVNTYTQKELKERLVINKTYTRYDADGKLYSIATDEKIYPSNISAVDVKEAEKEQSIKVKYRKSDKETITKEVNFFQHKAPTIITEVKNNKILIIKPDSELDIIYNGDTFGPKYNSQIKRYEYSVNGGEYTDIGCGNGISCRFDVEQKQLIGKKIKIRVIGVDDKAKIQEGKPTDEYLVEYKKIKVKFDANGGTLDGSSELEAIPGEKYPNFPTATKSGFKFMKWVDKYSNEVNEDDTIPSTEEDDTITLTAVWENATYNITYNSNGGSGTMQSTQCTVGEPCQLRTNSFTKSGYTFIGWDYYNNDYSQVNIGPNTKVNFGINTTLYAQWAANDYTVTFDPNANGGTVIPTTLEVKYQKEYTFNGALPIPRRTGYTYTGWYTSSSGGSKILDATPVETAGDHTLYAHWTANSYTVKFNANGGTVSQSSKTVTYDSLYGTLPTPTREGYRFDGWYTAANGGSRVYATTLVGIVEITDEQTLYAHWTANNYTVKFNANGGTVSQSSKTVTYDSLYGYLPTPTREGYRFDDWYTWDGKKVDKYTTVKITGEQTLYAHWTANSYTVTFDTMGGNFSSPLLVGNYYSISVTYNSTYPEFPEVECPGFVFDGWYTSPSGGEEVKLDTKVTINHFLYAHWSEIEYTVTLDPNGGSLNWWDMERYYSYGSLYGELPTPDRTNCGFLGWYTSLNGGDKVSPTQTVKSDHTLYAHWKDNTPTYVDITFDANGGLIGSKEIEKHQISYNSQYRDFPKPKREGYGFNGWYTSRNGGQLVTSISNATSNKYLYAHWIKNPNAIIVATGGSYKRAYNNSTIFRDNGVFYSVLIDNPERINEVKIKINSNEYNCGTIEKPGNWNEGFKSTFEADYGTYTRYFCVGVSLTSSKHETTAKVKYQNDLGSYETMDLSSLTIYTTEEGKCPDVTVSGTLGKNGWYTSKRMSFTIDRSDQPAIQKMEWYTNQPQSAVDVEEQYDENNNLIGYYKNFGLIDSSNPTRTLDSSTLYEFAIRKYIIRTYDIIDSKFDCKNEYKIDAEAPTLQITARKIGHNLVSGTESDSNYYQNFFGAPTYEYSRDGTTYKGGTILVYIENISDGGSDKSGYVTHSCKTEGVEYYREDSSFTEFRGFVRKGLTNVICEIEDNAGNKGTFEKVIYNNHVHVYGSSISSNKQSVAADALYNNWIIAKYDFNGPGTWSDKTCGHTTHMYNSQFDVAYITCIYCGATAVYNKERGEVGAWWCPIDTKNKLKTNYSNLITNLGGCYDNKRC